jgi:hypothetical protein
MSHKNRIFGTLVIMAAFGWAVKPLRAQETQLSVRAGAVGFGETSTLGYGVSFLTIPYGLAGFTMDLTIAHPSGGSYFSTSPSVVFFPVQMDEVKLGLLGGAGFYKLPGQSMKFGFSYGALGQFAFTEDLAAGLEMRAHPIFDSLDSWNVMLSLSWSFEGDGGW